MLPGACSAIPLAQVAWPGFYLSMGNVLETEIRWWGVGEFVLWVVFYFWAVWTFNALLPPKPEQTPFEEYLGKQVGQQTEGGARAERDQQLDDGTVDQHHQSLQHRH
jgi:hypothetical protein